MVAANLHQEIDYSRQTRIMLDIMATKRWCTVPSDPYVTWQTRKPKQSMFKSPFPRQDEIFLSGFWAFIRRFLEGFSLQTPLLCLLVCSLIWGNTNWLTLHCFVKDGSIDHLKGRAPKVPGTYSPVVSLRFLRCKTPFGKCHFYTRISLGILSP